MNYVFYGILLAVSGSDILGNKTGANTHLQALVPGNVQLVKRKQKVTTQPFHPDINKQIMVPQEDFRLLPHLIIQIDWLAHLFIKILYEV